MYGFRCYWKILQKNGVLKKTGKGFGYGWKRLCLLFLSLFCQSGSLRFLQHSSPIVSPPFLSCFLYFHLFSPLIQTHRSWNPCSGLISSPFPPRDMQSFSMKSIHVLFRKRADFNRFSWLLLNHSKKVCKASFLQPGSWT